MNDGKPSTDESWVELAAAIAAAETQLSELKSRFAQVERDRDRLAERRAYSEELKQEKPTAWKTELRHVEEEINTLEVNLESQLINWQSFREPFWQIVRFGGLGIVLGWVLCMVTQVR